MSESVEVPTTAFELSFIGGILVLLVGILVAVVGSALTFFLGGIGGWIGLPGMLWGILIIACAVMMRNRPNEHVLWGILIVAFSFMSWFGAFGGFAIGFLLSLIGGALGITWKPSAVAQLVQRPVMRICPSCGRVIDPDVKFCPHCGKALP